MTFLNFALEHQKELQLSLMRHMELVGISVLIGLVIALPLGIFLSRHHKLAGPILALAGTIQTVPGLVMLGVALILFGIGKLPALVVLSIYAVLPILRNTYTGISEVDEVYVEAGKGIGMTNFQILYKVELPLALASIVGGIRISAVYIVSWATLAAFIGSGGLGDQIITGLSTYNTNYILMGAIPSAIMAVVLSGLLGWLQSLLTPRGLREVNGN